MPRFDGTGPDGAGARTGWRRGPCGTGRRYPLGRNFGEPIPEEKEQAVLADQEKALKQDLATVRARIVSLKKQPKQEQ